MSKLQDLINELCPMPNGRQAEGVEFKKLSEIVKISRGKRVVRKELDKTGKYPVYQNSMTPLGYFNKYNCPGNTTFVISAGAAGEVGYSYENFWAADDCIFFTCPLELNSRYLYHVLMNNKYYLSVNVRRAAIPRLSRSVLENFKIPFPPIEVQREIVRILDNFDELIKNLERELELRKKQYAYYRDKLLTFEKLERGGGCIEL